VRRAAKRDGNHGEIVAAFRGLGCTVFETDRVGEGFPDLVVGCMGINHLVEVKNPGTRYGRKGLNGGQSAFNAEWRGGKVQIVVGPMEAAAVVFNWRRRASEPRGGTT